MGFTVSLDHANALLLEPKPRPPKSRRPASARTPSARVGSARRRTRALSETGSKVAADAARADRHTTPAAWGRPSSASSDTWRRPNSAASVQASALAAALGSPRGTSQAARVPTAAAGGYVIDVTHQRLYCAAAGTAKTNRNGFRRGTETLSIQDHERRLQERANQQNQLAERKLQEMAAQLAEKDQELQLAKQTIELLREPHDAQAEALRRAESTLLEQRELATVLRVQTQAAEDRARLEAQKAAEMAASITNLQAALQAALQASQQELEQEQEKQRQQLEQEQELPPSPPQQQQEESAIARVQAQARGRKARANFRSLVEAVKISEEVEARVLASRVISGFRAAVNDRSSRVVPIFTPSDTDVAASAASATAAAADVDEDEDEDGPSGCSWLQSAQHSASALASHLVELDDVVGNEQPEPEQEQKQELPRPPSQQEHRQEREEESAIARVQAQARGRKARANFRSLVEAVKISEEVEARVLASRVISGFRAAVNDRSSRVVPIFTPSDTDVAASAASATAAAADVDEDEDEDGPSGCSWLQSAQHSASALASHLVELDDEVEHEVYSDGEECKPAAADTAAETTISAAANHEQQLPHTIKLVAAATADSVIEATLAEIALAEAVGTDVPHAARAKAEADMRWLAEMNMPVVEVEFQGVE